jgi:adenine-specific DNA-methyltransferase
MSTPLEKFQTLLRELFQFEQADLDFGVYRIMNLRRERMERWLNEELPARARAILAQGGATADDDLSSRLEAVKTEILSSDPGAIDEDGNLVNQAWEQIPKGKEYLKLKEQADRAPARTAAGMEPLVYNHLYDFFSRYYDTGDFIPKRRRSFAPDGRDTYAIPWDGEEVVLHWANKDQYYIKTGERFTHYRWQSNVGGRTFTIEFRLTDADLPANNNKDAKKKFNLLVEEKVAWLEDKATLVLPFHYRGLTPEEEGQYTGTQEAKLRESIIKRTVDTLRASPAVGGVQHLGLALMAPKRDAAGQEKRDKDGNAVPLLPHHLNRWAVKNESDFFIHKDLRRFLSGELDYFLKSVVLNLDNLLAAGEQRAEPNFRLLDAVKRLGTEIVDFVSQLENFQKALFEKKKFVLETSWCLTLDRIPASVKEEVYAAILANDRQWEEWETLYKISQWPADLATVAIRTREFLDAYPYLMLDSALGYVPDLISSLLGGTEDIEQSIDGIIAHGDNVHALRLFKTAFLSKCAVGYIDPPYNKGNGTDFVYKDSFRHSSWLAMAADRLGFIKATLKPDGVLWTSLDENEAERFHELSEGLFGETKLLTAITNLKGIYDADGFVATHEYVICACVGKLTDVGEIEVDEATLDSEWEEDAYGYFKQGDGLRRTGADAPRNRRPKGWFAVFVDENLKPYATADDQPLVATDVPAWPIATDGTELSWSWSRKKINDEPHNLIVKGDREAGYSFYKKQRASIGDVPTRKARSFLYKPEYSSTHGGNTAKDLFGERMSSFTPKSVDLIADLLRLGNAGKDAWVLDVFAGSGTTGHSVMTLNRSDAGSRKYLLTEMGDAFDGVLKPRLQKVAFSERWRDGSPERQANGSNPYNGLSHCLKVIRLESYEDALDNIEFNSGAAPGSELGLDFSRDYDLRYALDWESKDCPTRLAVEQLDTPFDYTLTLRRESGTVEVKPDLPETFAYLIGLHTRRRFRTERAGVSYLIYTGALHENGTEVAVLWRTCKDWAAANLKAEMEWWCAERETLAPGATRVYVNGASAIEGHHSLDAEFKTRMHGGSG